MRDDDVWSRLTSRLESSLVQERKRTIHQLTGLLLLVMLLLLLVGMLQETNQPVTYTCTPNSPPKFSLGKTLFAPRFWLLNSAPVQVC